MFLHSISIALQQSWASTKIVIGIFVLILASPSGLASNVDDWSGYNMIMSKSAISPIVLEALTDL